MFHGKSVILNIIIFFVLILSASFYFLNNYKNHVFFIDEYEFMRKSYFFDLLFIKNDLKDERWYSPLAETGAPQPKVGPYIFGLALHLSGIHDIENTFRSIDFNEVNIKNNHWWNKYWMKNPSIFPDKLQPMLKIVYIGRITAIIFSIATIGLTYIIGLKLFNNTTGIVAALLFLFNRLFNFEGKFAMTDSMQLFFFCSNLLLLYYWSRFLQSKNPTKFIVISFLIGINTALGVGVKVSAAMIPIFLGTVFLVAIIKEFRSRYFSRVIISIMSIIGISFGLFYLLHPFIHPNIISNTWLIFHDRLEGAKLYYWNEFPGSSVKSEKKALSLIFFRTLSSDNPYGNFPIKILPVDFYLFVIGIVSLWKQLVKNFLKSGKYLQKSILPIWISVASISLIFYLKNDWSRYYLPLVWCITVTEAYVIVHTIKLLIQKIF